MLTGVLDELVPWLRRVINMAWQSAKAMDYQPGGLGGLVSQWTPERLADQCAMHIEMIEHLLASPDDAYAQRGIQLIAWTYRRASGYNEKWLPPGQVMPL